MIIIQTLTLEQLALGNFTSNKDSPARVNPIRTVEGVRLEG